jgi:ketosteroid isomerase-like protein
MEPKAMMETYRTDVREKSSGLLLALLAYALCMSSTALAQGTLRADADSTTEAEIQALEYHLIDLLQRRDLEAYAPYLAEDYRRVNREGRVSTKEEVLTELASPSPAGRAPARQVPSDMDVRVYGDTAILSFVLTTEREGEPPVRARLVKAFVRREGRWIMVHNQGTPLE